MPLTPQGALSHDERGAPASTFSRKRAPVISIPYFSRLLGPRPAVLGSPTMKTQRSLTTLLACLLGLLGIPLSAYGAGSVQERLKAQNALFDEYWETELKTHPQMASAVGDYRYNDQLNDYSLAGEAGENQRDEAWLA